MLIITKSRVLCCSHNHASIHDVHLSSPPSTPMKKPMKPEAESRTPLGREQVQLAPAFRSIPSLTSDDFDDIISLKRANPVCDSGEEDFRFVRRQLRGERDDEEESTVPLEAILHWSDQVTDNEEQGYLLSFPRNVE